MRQPFIFLLLGLAVHHVFEEGFEGFVGHGAEIVAVAVADGDGLIFHILVAKDDHIGDLVHLTVADLLAQGLRRKNNALSEKKSAKINRIERNFV